MSGAAVSETGPIASWTANELSGNLVADARGLSDGVGTDLERDVDSLWSDGSGKALAVNGATSKIDVSHVREMAVEEYTVRLLFQADVLPASGNVVLWAKDSGLPPGGLSIELLTTGGSTFVRAMVRTASGGGGTTAELRSTTEVSAGTGYLVWFTLSKTAGAKLYIGNGGTPEATNDTRTHGFQNNTGSIIMGAYHGPQGFFDGVLDGMALYNYPLDSAEIQSSLDARSIERDMPDPEGPPPPVDEHTCLARSSGTLVVVPATNAFYDVTHGNNTRYDGRNFHRSAELVGPRGNAFFGVRLWGARNGCWTGGSVRGTQTRNKVNSYGKYGNSKAFLFADNNQGCLFEAIRIDNWWDAFATAHQGSGGGGTGNTIRGCWVTYTSDDFIDMDNKRAGILIDDCLIGGETSEETTRGHHIIHAARGSDESNNFICTINRTIHQLALRPLRNLRSGVSNPTRGKFFKLKPSSVRYDIHDCHWHVGGPNGLRQWGTSNNDPNIGNPFWELISLNKLRNSSGNVIYSTIPGGWPSAWTIPAGFTVNDGGSAAASYNAKVQDWLAAHPLVSRIPVFDDGK